MTDLVKKSSGVVLVLVLGVGRGYCIVLCSPLFLVCNTRTTPRDFLTRSVTSTSNLHTIRLGMLKTIGPPFRMGQTRLRSRPFAVLTYWEYASRVNTKAFPFRDKLSNFALRDAASNTVALLDDFFDHSRRQLIPEFS